MYWQSLKTSLIRTCTHNVEVLIFFEMCVADDVARKRPIPVSEQVAVDERGRRRFHGAFTGGFSAGYFNTVGSKEGWAPSTFKSSRSDRNSFKSQNVLDFMDDEVC